MRISRIEGIERKISVIKVVSSFRGAGKTFFNLAFHFGSSKKWTERRRFYIIAL